MHVRLRGARSPSAVFVAVLALAGSGATPLSGQQEASPTVEEAELVRFARAHLAVAAARDAYHARLARSHEDNERERLRAELTETLAGILDAHEMSREEFDRFTVLVSTNAEARASFERILADLAAAPRDTTSVSGSSRR